MIIWPKVQFFNNFQQFFENDNFSNKKNIQYNDRFLKKAFGQMNFRSYVISVIWLVFQVIFSVKWPFFKYFRSNDLLINLVFGQLTFFGKMNFRSNGLWLNGDSIKCTFGQMVFGQTVFGLIVFRSNDLSVKIFRWNDFSVKFQNRIPAKKKTVCFLKTQKFTWGSFWEAVNFFY
jgi:hypothetical protein